MKVRIELGELGDAASVVLLQFGKCRGIVKNRYRQDTDHQCVFRSSTRFGPGVAIACNHWMMTLAGIASCNGMKSLWRDIP